MNRDIPDNVAKYLTIFALVVIVAVGLSLMIPNINRSAAIRQKNTELQHEIDLMKAKIAKLDENQRRFRSDPDFVEAIARQNHRVFPGELIFILDKK